MFRVSLKNKITILPCSLFGKIIFHTPEAKVIAGAVCFAFAAAAGFVANAIFVAAQK
jgi:hypothetical protein